jgi:hypothetical protein
MLLLEKSKNINNYSCNISNSIICSNVIIDDNVTIASCNISGVTRIHSSLKNENY